MQLVQRLFDYFGRRIGLQSFYILFKTCVHICGVNHARIDFGNIPFDFKRRVVAEHNRAGKLFISLQQREIGTLIQRKHNRNRFPAVMLETVFGFTPYEPLYFCRFEIGIQLFIQQSKLRFPLARIG